MTHSKLSPAHDHSGLHRRLAILVWALLMAGLTACSQSSPTTPEGDSASIEDFVGLLDPDPEVVEPALSRIRSSLPEGTATMLLEAIELQQFLPTDEARFGILEILREKLGMRNPSNLEQEWLRIWNQPYRPHPNYARYKSALLGKVFPKFAGYFGEDQPAPLIRLDEIRWGGVAQDGIPPLKDPQVVTAAEADWLAPGDTVFGVEVNGESRCYPKRILAWHEMVKDHLGGESINGVYCTLCGSMIVYFTEVDGEHFELGTSGLLYRSNKLMYDDATQSLWSTLDGRPVVGELVERGITLRRHPVVTTTWEAWRSAHPETTVLSLETGYNRNYGEGVAYRDYFSTDRLMFAVPRTDDRLQNKDEVVALAFPEETKERLAVACRYLQEHRIHYDRVGDRELVILTDEGGASRVYAAGDVRLVKWTGSQTLEDEQGRTWRMTEQSLTETENSDARLPRLPSHRAFWFGWFSAYPETRLVQ